MSPIQIAIDGPAGAGKSTVAKILAKKLGYIYIDTGAMYRAVTLAALREGLLLSNEEDLARLAKESRIELVWGKAGSQEVFLNGQLVNEEIRTPLINQNVSLVAKLPKVRENLVQKQQELANNHHVVMDGRDIGSVVLPSAELKIFLTATLSERAKRRYSELLIQGHTCTLAQVKAELEKRDQVDSSREISPLCVATDAVAIDTTGKSLEDIVENIIELMGCRTKE